MNIETWVPVSRDASYEVSNLGRVRQITKKNGSGLGVRQTKRNSLGYVPMMINRKKVYVHRLVLNAFVGPCPAGHECHHINGNRSDNRLENLRWVTRKENQQHRVAHGTHNRGEHHPQVKLTPGKVRLIRAMYATGLYFQHDLGQLFGVWQSCIGRIVSRELWKDVAPL